MAETFVDISAPSFEYQPYAATPTWGALSTDKPLPMDGNGKAGPGHSAAVAIAEIQITVLPADTNTLVIAGCTLTAKTTAAAKNQWTIGGSIATCITNLRDLINTFGTGASQCDAATPTTVSQLQLALPYWCFARVKPGTTDTLQIATRFAGSDLNQATNSNVGITSAGWATPPTVTQFAGGADGPWAYLLNTTTIFGKSDGQTGTAGPGYGLFFAASPTPFAPGATDVVHVRTKRGGSNLSVTWASSGTATASWKQRNYLFDDGTVWSGDNGKITVTFKNSNASSTNSIFSLPSNTTLSLVSRSKYNAELQVGVTASGSGSFTLFSLGSSGPKLVVRQCRLVETADNTQLVRFAVDGAGSIANPVIDFSDSLTQFKGLTTNKQIISIGSTSSTGVRITLNGLTHEMLAATAAIGTFIYMAGGFGTLEWIGGEVRDSLGVYRCANPFNIAATNGMDVLLDSVVGVTDPAIGLTASATNQSRLRWVSAEGPNKGFRNETPRYAIDWKGDGTFPYCGAAADLRGVNWSHRFSWTSVPTQFAPVTILKLSRFYRSASATRVVTLEMYLPTAATFYLDELEFVVSYMDSTDVWRNEVVGGIRLLQLTGSRTALSSSSASWTANSASGYSAKKLELTTAYPIKQNSEITARLSLCASRGSTLVGYVSPELGAA